MRPVQTCSVPESVSALGARVSALHWEAVPAPVAERLGTVLYDVLAANAAGARTEGQRAWRAAWPAPPGHSPVVGGRTLTDPVTASWLNGPATVCLEMDEGNKYAKGHPAAHVFPAVLSLAADLDVAGTDLAAALLAGYEVAARFGRATSLRRGAHPHGNWGVAGAAAGCARLLGLDAEHTATRSTPVPTCPSRGISTQPSTATPCATHGRARRTGPESQPHASPSPGRRATPAPPPARSANCSATSRRKR
ncbi:MAG TPA: MmgE/PrpD family protein [Amycolatopsis sp.]|nr:MmgE/PrpD family protein [Amycolatopsis sp.]